MTQYFSVGREISLGITLVILVTIGGQEISHLVHPLAAFIVVACACACVPVAFKRAR
jgi:flagellar motor component MotA